MKTMTIILRRNTAAELGSAYLVVAEHAPTKSRGLGMTCDEAVRDLLTCRSAALAAERCDLPVSQQAEDPICAHGVALDVHCCNCHSGFLFDPDSCVCRLDP